MGSRGLSAAVVEPGREPGREPGQQPGQHGDSRGWRSSAGGEGRSGLGCVSGSRGAAVAGVGQCPALLCALQAALPVGIPGSAVPGESWGLRGLKPCPCSESAVVQCS